MGTGHITKRCSSFAKICEMRGSRIAVIFPEKSASTPRHKSCQAFGNNRVVRQSAPVRISSEHCGRIYDKTLTANAQPEKKQHLPVREIAFDRPRDFLNNRFVYAVISPRARGLTLGVNMNPDKRCNFDCLYCEVDRATPPEHAVLDVGVVASELQPDPRAYPARPAAGTSAIPVVAGRTVAVAPRGVERRRRADPVAPVCRSRAGRCPRPRAGRIPLLQDRAHHQRHRAGPFAGPGKFEARSPSRMKSG